MAAIVLAVLACLSRSVAVAEAEAGLFASTTTCSDIDGNQALQCSAGLVSIAKRNEGYSTTTAWAVQLGSSAAQACSVSPRGDLVAYIVPHI